MNLETLQKPDFRYGQVTAYAIGPDVTTPEFSCISGDITSAYTKKVNKVTRSMVTLNTR